MIVGVNSSAAV